MAFPTDLEALLPIIDGFTPLVAADLQLYQDAILRIEAALGAGSTTLAGGGYGPKGGNASLRQRLDKFLEPEGGLRGIAFVTGTAQLGEFSEDQALGFHVAFGKDLNRGSSVGLDGYVVLFACQSPQADGNLWSGDCPALWWVEEGRTPSGFRMKARDLHSRKIPVNSTEQIHWACLALGYDAFYEG